MADDPDRGRSGELLYEEHEPTEKVDRASVTPHGVSADALASEPTTELQHALASEPTTELQHALASELPTELQHALPGAPPGEQSSAAGGPVFVSMKPPSEHGDKTDIVPAIERPDMRPRLRPVSEPPAWQPAPGALRRYATPRPEPRRSWLWLYLVLAAAAALAGAGVTLWLRTIW